MMPPSAESSAESANTAQVVRSTRMPASRAAFLLPPIA